MEKKMTIFKLFKNYILGVGVKNVVKNNLTVLQ